MAVNTFGDIILDPGLPGTVFDMNPADLVSKANATSTGIDGGRFVARTTGDELCKAVSSNSDVVMGLAIRPELNTIANVAHYPQNVMVPVARKGYFRVTAAETATRGDGVIAVVSGGGTVGSTTGGAAGTGRIAVSGTWETSTASGAIGVIRLDI